MDDNVERFFRTRYLWKMGYRKVPAWPALLCIGRADQLEAYVWIN